MIPTPYLIPSQYQVLNQTGPKIFHSLNNQSMAATQFPLDIELEILLKLPSKSLHRFKCVCKSWYSLFTNPNFISSYHSRTSLTPHLLLLHHPIYSISTLHFTLTPDTLLSFLDLGPTLFPPFYPPFAKRVQFFNTEAINGVVSVVYSGFGPGPETHCDLYLWNVFTGENVKTPVSDITGLFDGVPNLLFHGGFGFDECGEDYKVLRVVYVDSARVVTEVYSIKENRWRGLISQSGISSNTLWASSKCTFLRGVGYWGVYKKEKDKFFILGFDFRSELFRKISLPLQCVDGGEMRYHCLWAYNGLLAVSVLHFGDFESRVTRHYVWVRMGSESLSSSSGSFRWMKLFNIDLEGGPRRPICSLSNGELLCGESHSDYVLYDKQLELCKSVDFLDVDVVIPCVESLVSLNNLLPKSNSLT